VSFRFHACAFLKVSAPSGMGSMPAMRQQCNVLLGRLHSNCGPLPWWLSLSRQVDHHAEVDNFKGGCGICRTNRILAVGAPITGGYFVKYEFPDIEGALRGLGISSGSIASAVCSTQSPLAPATESPFSADSRRQTAARIPRPCTQRSHPAARSAPEASRAR